MHAPNHTQCISSAIQPAEQLCATRGARFRPMWRKVLQLIWESHQDVKAYDLLDHDIRNSTFYLKNFAPEPGRGVQLGFQISY